MIGSSFAALAGLLIAPNLQLSATALTLLVVQAFCAAAIGYFTNLPLTYVGGLLTGVAGAVATKYVVNVPWLIGFPSSLPFVVLFIVLLVTPRGGSWSGASSCPAGSRRAGTRPSARAFFPLWSSWPSCAPCPGSSGRTWRAIPAR